MHRPLFRALAALLLVFAAGCTGTSSSRIEEHSAEFAALDAGTQAKIRRGLVEAGYTANMVFMALGKPALIETDAAGSTIWTYRHYPATAYNETVQSGFRRRVFYDPVKRMNDIVIEPIDEKAFPHLVAYSLRIILRNNQVVTIERINRV